jgi:imidazolonepropionase-like amidohydrolase
VVRVGTLHTGREVLAPGVVVIEGGKVRSVGREIPTPAPEGRVIDLPEGWATPGWIDAASTAGIAGSDAEEAREVTPCVRPLRVFDPRAREVRAALRNGVTAILLEPGSRNVVAGIASVVKTAPGPAGAPRVVAEAAALRVCFGSDPSSGNWPARGIPASVYARRPTTRMGVLAVLRDAWILGRNAGPDAADADLAALARAAAGRIPIRAHARAEEDLRTVLRVERDLGFRPVVEGAHEGWRIADALAKAGVAAVVGPLAYPVSGRGPENTEPSMDNAGILHRAGVRIALTAGGDASGLRDQAALAVRWGLPREAALRAVTAEAAALCGAADRLGVLEPGRDADLVVFDGDPLEPASRVRWVVVDGTVAHGEEGK